MLRLSNALETTTTLALSGQDDLVKWAGRGLRAVGFGDERSLLVFGVTGTRRQAAQARLEALEIIRAHGGLMTGTAIGRMWRKSPVSIRPTCATRSGKPVMPWIHSKRPSPGQR